MKRRGTHDDGRLFGTDGVRIWTEPTLDLAHSVTVTESTGDGWATDADEAEYAREREALSADLDRRRRGREPAPVPDRSGEVDALTARWEAMRRP